METGIAISLILGIASIISSVCFGLIPGIRRNKLEKLEKKVRTLAQDVDSFYAIEQSLVEQLASATGKNATTLQKETRKQVKNDKGRPLSNYSTPSRIASELNRE